MLYMAFRIFNQTIWKFDKEETFPTGRGDESKLRSIVNRGGWLNSEQNCEE